MECEFKFSFPQDKKISDLMSVAYWEAFLPQDWQDIHLRAQYLDVADLLLKKELITLRLRQEDRLYCVTIKAKGEKEGYYSERQEWNFSWPGPEFSLKEFLVQEMDRIPEGLLGILSPLRDEPLIIWASTDIMRRQALLSYKECQAVLAIDQGFLYGGKKKELCEEVELEYLSGPMDQFLEWGDIFTGKLGFGPGLTSKAHRAFALWETEQKQCEE